MIVVFGSINLDIFFRCSRLPQPGETLLCPRAETAPGGKGANQALAARRAGARVALAGKVGRDAFAQHALYCWPGTVWIAVKTCLSSLTAMP